MLKNIRVEKRIIKQSDTLIHALKIMDLTGFRSLLIVDDSELFIGILSIGDIQRAIIKNIAIETKIYKILRPSPKIANRETPLSQIKDEMLRYRMEFLPVVDENKNITNIYFWDELFLDHKLPPKNQFDLPVVIMAGGFGSRLRPLTYVLPKPLIPIGNKTMMEEIFERFGNHGCKDFYISVNYKAELIEYYLRAQKLPYNLDFFIEQVPLGTAGSLSLLKGKIDQTFFVSNCDILIEQDYSEILDYHKEQKNDITIVAALKHYPIPYGTIVSGDDGKLIELKEKPELTLKINSGMYILEPHLLNEIPENTYFQITELIENIKCRNGMIGVFPITEKSWKDIGQWSELTYHQNSF